MVELNSELAKRALSIPRSKVKLVSRLMQAMKAEGHDPDACAYENDLEETEEAAEITNRLFKNAGKYFQ